MKKLLLTKKEVAKSLSVGINIIDELVKRGKLESVEVKPGINRIIPSSVKKYLKTQKGYEVIWTCDYCKDEFNSKIKSDEHELSCKENPKNNEIIFKIRKPNSGTIFGWVLLFIFLYFLTYFVANSYAKSNGLPIRDLIQPQKWFSSEVEKETTTSVPTPTLYQVLPTIKTVNKVNNTQNNNSGVVTDMVNCNINAKCGGGTKLMKKSECDSSYCCFLKDGTAKLLSSKSACDNYFSNTTTNQNTNTTNYPPCIISHPEGGSSTYYNISPEQCKKDKDTFNSIYNASKPAPTSSYVAPTTYVYQTPTSNQAYIDQCKAICSSSGVAALKKITEFATSMGTINTQWYTDDVAKNRDWVSNCQNDCR